MIRRTIENDIPALIKIVSKNYDKKTAENFSAEILCAFSNYVFRPNFYTALVDDKLIGCAGYIANWLSDGSFSLIWVNIDAEYQNQGYGKALVNKCLLDLNSIATLVLLATTVPMFYSKNWNFNIIDKFNDSVLADTVMSLKL